MFEQPTVPYETVRPVRLNGVDYRIGERIEPTILADVPPRNIKALVAQNRLRPVGAEELATELRSLKASSPPANPADATSLAEPGHGRARRTGPADDYARLRARAKALGINSFGLGKAALRAAIAAKDS
jgi:hypothetical protein